MGFFSKQLDFLGIDFRGDSVKIVQLKNDNGKASLATYGFTEGKIENEKKKGLEESEEELVRTIKAVVKKAQITTTKAIAALPAFSVFSSVVSLPELKNNKELEEVIKNKARKIIPLPLEEMVLDWKMLPKKESNSFSAMREATSEGIIKKGAQGNVEVLITASTKKLVTKYIDIFKQTNLNLVSLETETFALSRSLIGNDKSTIMVVNMGANITTLAVVDNKVPYFSKSIKMGGSNITDVIAGKMGVNQEEAEQFKRDEALMGASAGGQLIPKIIEEAIAPIVTEIRFSLNQFQSQTGKKPDKIILTGGSSLLPNLPAYFSSTFGINTYIGDPWARVIYPKSLKPVLDEIGPRFAVAVGLAMRNIE